jgi:hypothetical protein
LLVVNFYTLLRRIFLILLFTPVFFVYAQETESQLYRNEIKNDRFDAGLPIVSFMLMPAFTPEMKFNFTGGALLSFKTKRNNPYLSHSYLPLILHVTPHGDFSGSASLMSYWADDRFLFTLGISTLNRDDNYWGIGMEAAQSVIEGARTTAYHQKLFHLEPVVYARILNNLYAGITIQWERTNASQLNDMMKEDTQIAEQGTTINSSGAGIAVLFDSRDTRTNPVKGIKLGMEGVLFNKMIGSTNNFGLITVNYSQSHPVIREGSVLAWNVNTSWSMGDVPWTALPQLGSMNNLRGLYSGQFRDKSMAFAVLEYRHTLFKRTSSELSRHGFVFWLCGGTVFQSLGSINNGILSTGFGYRFNIQPQINLRIDIGFTADNTGIYMGFGEAF